MKIDIFRDAESAAHAAALFVAAECRDSVAVRGRFVVALSGGRTPWLMLRALTHESIPWDAIHLLQVDERSDSESRPAHLAVSDRERQISIAYPSSGGDLSIPAGRAHKDRAVVFADRDAAGKETL